MKCSECKYKIKTKFGWDCKISPDCVNDEDWTKHKCYGCVWGTFTGISYKCALPKCKADLGKIYGVGKNGR